MGSLLEKRWVMDRCKGCGSDKLIPVAYKIIGKE
jgi:hypothetical protein